MWSWLPLPSPARASASASGAATALDRLDLTVPQGAVHGLLGPNGAGKTTAVRILATLLRPDSGRARVAGFDVARQASRVRARIGLAGQNAAVDEILSGRQNLVMFGRLYHLPANAARRRADELLSQFALTEAGGKPVGQYSGGMRRRLDLAASFIVAPRVLFLDEPTTGLDPHGRNEVWQIDPRAGRRRHDGAAHHAVPGGGRSARRRHLRDRRGPRHRRRHPGRAEVAGRRRPDRRRAARSQRPGSRGQAPAGPARHGCARRS